MTSEEAKNIIIIERDGLKANPNVIVDCCLYEAFETAIKALEQEPKWIPVSERLPRPYEQVLRTVKSFGWNSTLHIHVDIGTICPIDTDFIAWMPLPKPYASQESEE